MYFVIKPLPKWAMIRYAQLFSRYKNKEFTYENVIDILENQNMASVTLTHLKKNGWIKVKIDPEDSRKRVYQLIKPEKAVMVMSSE